MTLFCFLSFHRNLGWCWVPFTDLAQVIQTIIKVKQSIVLLHVLSLFLSTIHQDEFRFVRVWILVLLSVVQHLKRTLRIDQFIVSETLRPQEFLDTLLVLTGN